MEGDVESSLKQHVMLFEKDWQNKTSEVNEEELRDLSATFDGWKKRIQNAEETIADSISRFEKLGLSSSQVRALSNDELDQFLLDVSQAQHESLIEFTNIERITVKILVVIEKMSKTEEYKRTKNELKNVKQRISDINDEIRSLDGEIDILKEVIRNVPKAVDQLNEKVIGELFETIRAIFSRVNSHPLYKKIHFDKGQRYGSNNLLLTVLSGQEQEEGTSANPSFIFSAAQLNSIALSLFLAMALQQQWSTLRLIAMDDPVQSMDDLNVLALIDLIRVLCDQTGFDKQFIISTHDTTFYQLMLTKFRFLRVGVIEYEGYSEKGPMIREHQNELGRSTVRLIEPLTKKKFSSDFLSVEVSKSI